MTGEAFTADASEVHTYIVNFTAGNETAESKLLAIADQNNGPLDFKALQEHYEGVGINSIAIRDADNVIEKLQYSGERRPTMWWDLRSASPWHSMSMIRRSDVKCIPMK